MKRSPGRRARAREHRGLSAGAALAACLALALPAPRAARAEGPPAASDPAKVREASELYARGAELLAKEQYAEALDALEQSYALVPSPNSSLLMARCLRELDRLADAVKRYELAEAEARERIEAGERRYVPTAQSAASEGAALRTELGTVALRVKGAPEGTIVEHGGAKTRLPSDGRLTLWNEPGEAVIVVRPPSGAEVTRKVPVAQGAEAAVEVDLAGGASGGAGPRPDGGAGSRSARPWALPAAIAAGSVGLVGMGMFIGFGVGSQARFDRLRAECGTSCFARRDEVEAGDREQTVANVMLAVGLVGLAAGATFGVLWLTDTGAQSAARAASPPRMALVVGVGGAGEVRVRGEF